MGFLQFTHINFFAWVTVDYIREGYLKADIHKSNIHVTHTQWKSHLHAHPHRYTYVNQINLHLFRSFTSHPQLTLTPSQTTSCIIFSVFLGKVWKWILLSRNYHMVQSFHPSFLVLEHYSPQHEIVLKWDIRITVVIRVTKC